MRTFWHYLTVTEKSTKIHRSQSFSCIYRSQTKRRLGVAGNLIWIFLYTCFAMKNQSEVQSSIKKEVFIIIIIIIIVIVISTSILTFSGKTKQEQSMQLCRFSGYRCSCSAELDTKWRSFKYHCFWKININHLTVWL